jgi:lysozyme
MKRIWPLYMACVATCVAGWAVPWSTLPAPKAANSTHRLLDFTPWLLNSVKGFENLSLKSYQDTKKHRAIGYGHRVKGVGTTSITPTQAHRWLIQDLRNAGGCVEDAIEIPLTQNQRDALVSFTFNVGCGRFKRSGVVTTVNAPHWEGAAIQMLAYVKSDGRVSRGLVYRRRKEVEHFLS